MKRHILFIALACLALASCSGEQHSDLRQFVKDSDNMPRGRIPPLPEVKPYEPFAYAAFDLIDPFEPRKIEPPKRAAEADPRLPDPNRRKEPLEAFPLENLKMVGTLAAEEGHLRADQDPGQQPVPGQGRAISWGRTSGASPISPNPRSS